MKNIKRLDAKGFSDKLSEYDTWEDAFEDGVGTIHSFPPLGDIEVAWNKYVYHMMSS